VRFTAYINACTMRVSIELKNILNGIAVTASPLNLSTPEKVRITFLPE